MEQLISLADAAELLGIAHVTLRAARARGRIDAKLFGNTYVTTRAEVERYRRESLGQVGRPADPVLELRDRLGYVVRATLGVNPSDMFAAKAWIQDGFDRATAYDGRFDLGRFQLTPDAGFAIEEPKLEGINEAYSFTVRQRAVFVDGLGVSASYVSPTLTKGRASDPKAFRRPRG